MWSILTGCLTLTLTLTLNLTLTLTLTKVEDVEAFMEELAAAAAGNSTHEEHQTSRI